MTTTEKVPAGNTFGYSDKRDCGYWFESVIRLYTSQCGQCAVKFCCIVYYFYNVLIKETYITLKYISVLKHMFINKVTQLRGCFVLSGDIFSFGIIISFFAVYFALFNTKNHKDLLSLAQLHVQCTLLTLTR